MAKDVFREVEQLLSDREKYEGWLNRLESQKSATSAAAYERVRADYQQRLDGVLGQLQSHADAIHGKLRQVEQSVVELDAERTERAESLDEARLRHSVGEYQDEAEWGHIEGELVAALQEKEGELKGARAEIARLQEIVNLVEGRPEPEPDVVPEPEPVAELEPAAEPEPAGAPEFGPPSEPAVAAPQPALESEEGYVSLEELVLEDKPPEEAIVREPLTAAAPEPGAGAPAAEPGVGDELAFLESLSLSGGSEEGEEGFAFLEKHGSGTPQTIVCPHCSAANDPAEWYCTECGEELPAE